MNVCQKEMVALIHKYLDEEISEKEKLLLDKHIEGCDCCKNHLSELKRTITYVQASSHLQAPSDFTSTIMKQLPKQNKSVGWKLWMKKHPALVAAAVFMLMFSTTFVSMFSDDGVSVSGQGNVYIDKETNTVVVPEGSVIEGDLVVKNADVQIEGSVLGNVKVLKGQHYQASAGQVSGEIEEIDKTLEWVWYNIKSFFSDVIDVKKDKEVD